MLSNVNGFSQPESTQPVELSPTECLELLNSRDYIRLPNCGANSQIVRVITSPQGITNRYWIHFESGVKAYIPSDAKLLSPDQFALCLTASIHRPVIIKPTEKKLWKLCDAAWVMIAAQEIRNMSGSMLNDLEEILAEPEYVHSNGPISSREVAAIFVDEAKALKYANDGHPHVAVCGADGLYVYFPALRRTWNQRHGDMPNADDLRATLYQVGFKPTSPIPAAKNRASSIRLWRKKNEENR